MLRDELLENETALSWLIRMIFRNGLPSVRSFLRYLGQLIDVDYLQPNDINTNKYPDLIFILARLSRTISITKFSEHILFSAFPNGYISSDREKTWAYKDGIAIVQTQFRVSPRFCPLCVNSTPHVRLEWHLDWYRCCSIHHVMLIERCPECKELFDTETVIKQQCRNCHHMFSKTEVIEINVEHSIYYVQVNLLNWLKSSVAKIQLVHQTPCTTLATFVGVGDVISNLTKHSKESLIESLGIDYQSVLGLEQFDHLILAFEVINNWSLGFLNLIETLRKQADQSEIYGFNSEFGVLYTKWLTYYWNTSEFQFVHDVFNQYISEQFVPYEQMKYTLWIELYPRLLQDNDFIPLIEIVSSADWDISTIMLMLRTGKLSIYTSPDTQTEYLRKSELKRL